VTAAESAALPWAVALRALIYLDWHIILNRLRTIRRDPKRLIIWGIFLAWLLLLLPQRFLLTRERPPSLTGMVRVFETASLVIPGIVLLAVAAVVAGSRRAFGLFRSAADARFLCGSALPRRLVVLWLDFRLVRMSLAQLPLFAFWLVILPFSFGTTVGRLLEIAASIAFFSALVLGLNLPMMRLDRRRPGTRPIIAGAIAVLGVTSLAAASIQITRASGSAPVPIANFLTALPPGAWIVAGFRGDPWALLALALAAGVAIAWTVIVADDVYPELWETSRRTIAVRQLVRRRGPFLSRRETREALREAGVAIDKGRGRLTTASSSRGVRVPGGAWTLLWKEWLAARRVRGGLRWPVVGLVVAVAFGWAVGGGFGRLPSAVTFTLLTLPAYLLLFINVAMSIRLGIDLKNPLWWLSAASLRARLLVLVLARSLRQVVPLAAGLLAAAVASRSAGVFALGLPLFAAAIWAMQSMGFATYVIIPTPADMRGPGQMLRVLALFVLVIPIFIVFAVAAAAAHSLVAGLLAGGVTAVMEGWALLMFAASRLAGNGLAFAQAERR
jgi:Putative ABC exporter